MISPVKSTKTSTGIFLLKEGLSSSTAGFACVAYFALILNLALSGSPSQLMFPPGTTAIFFWIIPPYLKSYKPSITVNSPHILNFPFVSRRINKVPAPRPLRVELLTLSITTSTSAFSLISRSKSTESPLISFLTICWPLVRVRFSWGDRNLIKLSSPIDSVSLRGILNVVPAWVAANTLISRASIGPWITALPLMKEVP